MKKLDKRLEQFLYLLPATVVANLTDVKAARQRAQLFDVPPAEFFRHGNEESRREAAHLKSEG